MYIHSMYIQIKEYEELLVFIFNCMYVHMYIKSIDCFNIKATISAIIIDIII